MNSKRIIILRNTKSDFIFHADYIQFLVNRLKNENYHIFVYDVSRRKLMDFKDETTESYITIPSIFNKGIIRITLNFIALIIWGMKNRGKYDITHFMYCRLEYLLSASILSKLSTTNIVSIFGSDFYNNKKIHKIFSKIYYIANYIHFTNSSSATDFTNYMIKINDQLYKKTKVLVYPISRINTINKLTNENKISIYSKYDIRPSSIVILCGINSNKNEQHELIIQSIASIQDEIGDTVIILPLTYGGNEAYKQQIIELSKTKISKLQIIILTEYLPETEMAAIVNRCNIYVNIRSSDQIASSVLECFYSSCLVITGSWLPYKSIKDYGFYYREIDNTHEELTTCIKNSIADVKNNDPALLSNLQQNTKLVIEYFDPEVIMREWINFYKSLN